MTGFSEQSAFTRAFELRWNHANRLRTVLAVTSVAGMLVLLTRV